MIFPHLIRCGWRDAKYQLFVHWLTSIIPSWRRSSTAKWNRSGEKQRKTRPNKTKSRRVRPGTILFRPLWHRFVDQYWAFPTSEYTQNYCHAIYAHSTRSAALREGTTPWTWKKKSNSSNLVFYAQSRRRRWRRRNKTPIKSKLTCLKTEKASEMPVKHCSWCTCSSDGRFPQFCEGVRFVPFTKPTRTLETCLLWTKACGCPQSQSSVSKIMSF